MDHRCRSRLPHASVITIWHGRVQVGSKVGVKSAVNVDLRPSDRARPNLQILESAPNLQYCPNLQYYAPKCHIFQETHTGVVARALESPCEGCGFEAT